MFLLTYEQQLAHSINWKNWSGERLIFQNNELNDLKSHLESVRRHPDTIRNITVYQMKELTETEIEELK